MLLALGFSAGVPLPLVAGMVLLVLGFGGAWFVGAATPVPVMLLLLLLGGLGLGLANTNLLLAVQNSVGLANMGAATSSVSFFRALSGALGIQLMGLVYGNTVEANVAAELGASRARELAGAAASVDLASLSGPVESTVRAAYADAIAPTFGLVGLICLVGLAAVLAMPAIRLRDTVDL